MDRVLARSAPGRLPTCFSCLLPARSATVVSSPASNCALDTMNGETGLASVVVGHLGQLRHERDRRRPEADRVEEAGAPRVAAGLRLAGGQQLRRLGRARLGRERHVDPVVVEVALVLGHEERRVEGRRRVQELHGRGRLGDGGDGQRGRRPARRRAPRAATREASRRARPRRRDGVGSGSWVRLQERIGGREDVAPIDAVDVRVALVGELADAAEVLPPGARIDASSSEPSSERIVLPIASSVSMGSSVYLAMMSLIAGSAKPPASSSRAALMYAAVNRIAASVVGLQPLAVEGDEAQLHATRVVVGDRRDCVTPERREGLDRPGRRRWRRSRAPRARPAGPGTTCSMSSIVSPAV